MQVCIGKKKKKKFVVVNWNSVRLTAQGCVLVTYMGRINIFYVLFMSGLLFFSVTIAHGFSTDFTALSFNLIYSSKVCGETTG